MENFNRQLATEDTQPNVDIQETEGQTSMEVQEEPINAPEVSYESPQTNDSKDKDLLGFVKEGTTLNVRAAPSIKANVICVISQNSTVLIDSELSTSEFYKICTEAGVEGFCMREFIQLKSLEV